MSRLSIPPESVNQSAPDAAGDYHVQRLADGAACLAAALDYLARGWSVLAVCTPDHVGVGKTHAKNCTNPGKAPWGEWAEYQTRLSTEDELRRKWRDNPQLNVGIALGPVSGLIRVDVEGEAGEMALAKKSGGDLPPTLEFKSGRGEGTGRGLLYRLPAGATLKTTKQDFGRGSELRFQAKGAQTVLPPSRHKDGGYYAWLPGHAPGEIEPAFAPGWLLVELTEHPGHTGNGSAKKRRTAAEWAEVAQGVPEGQRHDSGLEVMGKMIRILPDLDNASDVATLRELVLCRNRSCDPPEDEDKVFRDFNDILGRERQSRAMSSPEGLEKYVETDGASEWHMRVKDSEPVQYQLKTHFWSRSPRLKDGYLPLSAKQVRNWSSRGDSIPAQAMEQAGVVVPETYKSWKMPGGRLQKLLDHAEHIPALAEEKRDLYILGFIYRNLRDARRLNEGSISTPLSRMKTSNGRPTQEEDGSVVFMLPHLRAAIYKAGEDFTLKEVTNALKSYGRPHRNEEMRFWRVRLEDLRRMGREAEEVQA